MSYAETVVLDVRIGQMPQVVSALTGRDGLAVWVSEIGVLNRVVLFRTATTYESLLDGRPALLALIPKEPVQSVDVTSWRVISPLLPAGKHGGIYEWRCYELKLGQAGEVEEAFAASVPGRLGLSPLLCGMISIEGTPRLAHIWPYADMNVRLDIRIQAVTSGVWPPKIGSNLVAMENTVLLPAQGSAWH
ncbi:NIPSNAP family protein [Gluconobacter sp. Dm-62]|uniref:NIPSNAP family protein n=1 Tax=Gluconobacter sp. Dm-62 TaxID=2799804 RepID=UPI001B8B3BD5|nr:NIPSNAP family protein [Gluconobacter sp. Dm-62]MBS1102173.1 NIPSNAP family protein [Gluconobacter sp. Dm-62]